MIDFYINKRLFDRSDNEIVEMSIYIYLKLDFSDVGADDAAWLFILTDTFMDALDWIR